MKEVRALIITGFGINCEEELAAAYKLAGAETQIAHLNDLFQNKLSIHEFDILNFPGGFSFGDDLGSGKVLANKMKYKTMKNGKPFFTDLLDFIAENKFILGVCNGFQFLVKMGLLPNNNNKMQQEVTLTRNNSARFEDRWCYLKVNKNSKTPFLDGIDIIKLPVRHGEGKIIIGNELNCLSYCTESGEITSQYPLNPNGSDLNCAALTDSTGHIFGLMPHPEAFLSFYNDPEWPELKRKDPEICEKGQGLRIFENIVEYIKKNRT